MSEDTQGQVTGQGTEPDVAVDNTQDGQIPLSLEEIIARAEERVKKDLGIEPPEEIPEDQPEDTVDDKVTEPTVTEPAKQKLTAGQRVEKERRRAQAAEAELEKLRAQLVAQPAQPTPKEDELVAPDPRDFAEGKTDPEYLAALVEYQSKNIARLQDKLNKPAVDEEELLSKMEARLREKDANNAAMAAGVAKYGEDFNNLNEEMKFYAAHPLVGIDAAYTLHKHPEIIEGIKNQAKGNPDTAKMLFMRVVGELNALASLREGNAHLGDRGNGKIKPPPITPITTSGGVVSQGITATSSVEEIRLQRKSQGWY